MVPPSPVAFGVWSRTPAINRTASTTSMMISAFLTCAIGLLVAGLDSLPVQGVEPGRDIVRALVLILQVVRVLPDVDAEDGPHVLHVRAVLVRVGLDRKLAPR